MLFIPDTRWAVERSFRFCKTNIRRVEKKQNKKKSVRWWQDATSGLGRRRLAQHSVAGAQLRLGDVGQRVLDLLQQHVAAVHHLLQTGRCVVVLLLQLTEAGRLATGRQSCRVNRRVGF